MKQVFYSTTIENLEASLRDCVNEMFQQFILKYSKTKDIEKPLDVAECAEFLNISKSDVYKKTSQRKIPFYKAATGGVYFFKSELYEFIKSGRVKTTFEIDSESIASFRADSNSEIELN